VIRGLPILFLVRPQPDPATAGPSTISKQFLRAGAFEGDINFNKWLPSSVRFK
jgi:hypothetical protein